MEEMDRPLPAIGVVDRRSRDRFLNHVELDVRDRLAVGAIRLTEMLAEVFGDKRAVLPRNDEV